MTSAYVLILAMLVLGGLLATLGDRLGTKVGKARLSLFNLRPRQTATIVTIITGIIISASTLGILFATSKSLRVGIFELDEKLKELRQAREELTNVSRQKTQVEQALAEAKTEQTQVQKQLDEINEYLLEAIDRQTETAAKLNQAETKLSQTQTEFQLAKTQLSLIESQYQRAQSQLETFSDQAQTLRQEIQKLQSERQELLRQTEEVKVQIAQRDQEIAKRQLEIEQRDAEIAAKQSQIVAQEAQISQQEAQISQREVQISQREAQISQQEVQISQQEAQISQQGAQISQQGAQISQQKEEITEKQEQIARRQAEIDQRDRVIAEREKLLKQLEREQAFLERDIENLELNFQFLREGNFALLRNQVLASGVVRVLKPAGARQAAEELLREANLAAIERIRPGTNADQEKVVQITPTEFERLVNEINDGQAYVVRILSSANYLVGENIVQVFADAAINKIVFLRGEVLAGTSVSPATMTEEDLRERIDLLLASASFRARRAGILAGPIEIAEGRLTLLEFIEKLQQYDREVIVQAIASEATYTAGPLKVNLVVIQNGQMIFNN